MERIEGNRVRIIGCKLDTERDTRTSQERQLEEIYQNTNIKSYFRSIGNVAASTNFQRDTCFMGVHVSNAPKPRRNRVDVNIDGPFGVRMRNTLRPVETSLREEGETEPVLAFAFDGGKKVRALFYKRLNTLIFGSLPYNSYETRYLGLVVEWLSTNGHIAAIPPEPVAAAAPESYIHMVEIHKGEQKIVKLAVNRKLCTVGCDPEFELLLRGQVVQAPEAFKGTSMSCEIGTDGAGNQIEIRPKAFEKPSDTISYMVGIMQRFPETAGLSVAGNRFPLGGHVHVGVGRAYSPTSDLAWMLDRFLGEPTLELSGGARSYYKKLGMFESKNWGYEYRTPPGAIFCSPEIARIALKICKTITECYVNGQTMEMNQPLQFEDYWNYAGLIPSEYETWQNFLSNYNTSAHRTASADVRAGWVSEGAVKRYPSQIEAAKASSAIAPFMNRLRDYPLTPQSPRPRSTERLAADFRQAQPVPRMARFNDEWAPEVQEMFTAALRDAHVTSAPYFFGLSSSRGDSVFGFDMPGYSRIEGDWRGYGIPYSVRMVPHPSDIARAWAVAAHLAGLLAPVESTVAAIPQVQQELPSVRTPDDGIASTAGRTPEQEFDAAFDPLTGSR